MLISYLLLYCTGNAAPIAVSFEHSRYHVNESSGSFDITIVTSGRAKFSFTAKLSVSLQSRGAQHGNGTIYIYIYV